MSRELFDLDKVLKEQAFAFGQEYAKVLSDLAGLKVITCQPEVVQKELVIQADFIASVAFVGMVTGEFIVAVTKDEARVLFQEIQTEEEIQDLLTESLNMAAGSRLRALTQQFQKVTIQSPKIVSGRSKYPNVKNVPIGIKTERGVINAYFFIDQMQLDLAESYKAMISDLKKINQDLTHANGLLKTQQAQLVQSEKMASLGMLAAGVAHEINNPLAFVVSNNEVLANYVDAMRSLLIGYDQMLKLIGSGRATEAKSELQKISQIKKKEDFDYILEDTRKLLAESKFGLERIRGIVSGLKRFSRVDDGGIKKIQLNDEIQNTLLLLQNELKYRCKVVTDLRAEQELECLPGEINQVFVNLIINAAQAIQNPEGILTIQTSDFENRVIVKVKDTGCGISEENLEKLFQPFFTTKPVGEGTGLGLAISFGIVQKHGGQIKAESKVGEGTVFTVELPTTMKLAA